VSGRARALVEHAGAKINLTLHVLGRRPDGYHELESLVAFARVGDRLTLVPGDRLGLLLRGPFADGIDQGPDSFDDNLVVKATRELVRRVGALRFGRFTLTKRLPVASGIGGGSADAAAALRLVARANGLAPDDPRLLAAAGAVGADVPVCVDPRPRVMRGIGEILSAPLALPAVAAVLVNPGVPVETRAVFAALARERAGAGGAATREAAPDLSPPPPARGRVGVGVASGRIGVAASAEPPLDPLPNPPPFRGREQTEQASRESATAASLTAASFAAESATPISPAALLALICEGRNDLEPVAITIAPAIAEVLDLLRATPGCRLARMSGSGATCFALYDSRRAAGEAAQTIRETRPAWWTQATVIG
jgi:4-diphosphocytidyl-2-C-methyl-D-erythritol kinase